MSMVSRSERSALQAHNRAWWEANPMTYDWAGTLQAEPGTAEFYAVVDERFFRSCAHFGHPHYPQEVPFARRIDYAGLRGQRVLEIGCGAGAMAAVMSQQGLRVSAIDITARAIAFARRRFQICAADVDLQLADAEHLPYADNAFAMIWSWGVIHHSANMQAIVDEMQRVLVPGGQAKVMVYHRHALRNWILAGLRQGILRGKLLTTPYEEILRSVTDGYIARHLTRRQAHAMFRRFRRVDITLTDLADLSYLPGNLLVDRYLTGTLIPTAAKRWWDGFLMGRWGWFMYIEATL